VLRLIQIPEVDLGEEVVADRLQAVAEEVMEVMEVMEVRLLERDGTVEAEPRWQLDIRIELLHGAMVDAVSYILSTRPFNMLNLYSTSCWWWPRRSDTSMVVK